MKSLIRILSLCALAGLARAAGPVEALSPAEPLPNPFTLDAALSYGLKHNPTLNRVREQVREQQGVLVTVNARRLPQLDASGSYGRSDKDLLTVLGGTQDSWGLELAATQTLYAGGGLKASSGAQRNRVEAAKLAVLSQSDETVLTIRQGFYQALLERELINVHEESLQVLEKELADAQARRLAGTASDFEVLRAGVAVANARPGLIHARNAYRTSLDKLRSQLGLQGATDGSEVFEPAGELAEDGSTPELGAVLQAARNSRPEVHQQRHLLEAAKQGITAARAGYQPTFTAYAAHEWTSTPLSSQWNRRIDGWTAGVKGDWAIFDGRATAGKVRQARSQVQQADFALDEVLLQVDIEVRTAHAALLEANELLVSAKQTVTQAKESLRLAQVRHAAGTATQLDVLSAQAAVTEARSTYSQARHDHALALARLQRATGVASAGAVSS